jgi:hypothetical protein
MAALVGLDELRHIAEIVNTKAQYDTETLHYKHQAARITVNGISKINICEVQLQGAFTSGSSRTRVQSLFFLKHHHKGEELNEKKYNLQSKRQGPDLAHTDGAQPLCKRPLLCIRWGG